MEWDREMACMRAKGRAEGREEGREEKAVEDARNLIKLNLGNPEQIAQAVGLPLEQVLELQKEFAQPAPAN